MGDTGKILIAVAATAVVAGGIGAIIYFAKKPATLSTGQVAADTAAAKAAVAKTAADKAAADKAAADAAAAKAAADAAKAAADAQRKAAGVAALNAFSAVYNTNISQQGVSAVQAMTAAFISGIQAVQALGIAPSDVLDIAWNSAADFLVSIGWSRGQAETLASDAQQAAGFGRHTTSSGPTMSTATARSIAQV